MMIHLYLLPKFTQRADIPMNSTAIQAENVTETNAGPLWIFHAAIAALAVAGHSLDNSLITCGHLHHGKLRVLF